MGNLHTNGERVYNKIPIQPFKIRKAWPWQKESVDIVLSTKRDLCDFLALGIYCLNRSITNPNGDKEICVRFSNRDFRRKSGVTMIIGNQGYRVPTNALECQVINNLKDVFDYVFEKNPFNGILGIEVYPTFTAYVNGVFKADTSYYDDVVPKREWKISDTEEAQEFAYRIVKRVLDNSYPFISN